MTRPTLRPLHATALLAGLFLFGCGGGGGSSVPTGPATASLCADFQSAQAGEYAVENNTWGKGDLTSFRQCVGIAAADGGGANVAFDWTWPAPLGGVRGYPEVIYGQKPWNASTTTRLPRVVDDVKAARVDLGFVSTREGIGNLAFDIWLTTSNVRPAGSDHLPLAHELMIWLDHWGGMVPAGGTPVDTVTLGGITWDLYATTATWGPEPWQYLAYFPRTAVPSPATLDLRQFLDHLKARGSITGREWLASVELGNELMLGSGRTTLSQFKVSVE